MMSTKTRRRIQKSCCMPKIMFSEKELQIWDFEAFIFGFKFRWFFFFGGGGGGGGAVLGAIASFSFVFGQLWWSTFLLSPSHHKKSSHNLVIDWCIINKNTYLIITAQRPFEALYNSISISYKFQLCIKTVPFFQKLLIGSLIVNLHYAKKRF